jgi:hypothetical protein
LVKYKYVFKSGIEEDTFEWLLRFARKGKYVAHYETESIPYIIEGTYKPDFVLSFDDGTKMYIETKGYFDPPSRRKMAAVLKTNPDKDFRLVFAKDNFLSKSSKIRYSDWAKKHGFKYSIGRIPDDWLRLPEKKEDNE